VNRGEPGGGKRAAERIWLVRREQLAARPVRGRHREQAAQARAPLRDAHRVEGGSHEVDELEEQDVADVAGRVRLVIEHVEALGGESEVHRIGVEHAAGVDAPAQEQGDPGEHGERTPRGALAAHRVGQAIPHAPQPRDGTSATGTC
jgi:hypothetical protein